MLKNSFNLSIQDRYDKSIKQALSYYLSKGYRLIAQSQLIAGVEIDLIFGFENSILLVEVKSVATVEQLERIKTSGQLKRLKRAHEFYQEINYGSEVESELFVLEGSGKTFVYEDFLV